MFTIHSCASKAKGELKNYSIIFERKLKGRGKKKLATVILEYWARLPGPLPPAPQILPETRPPPPQLGASGEGSSLPLTPPHPGDQPHSFLERR